MKSIALSVALLAATACFGQSVAPKPGVYLKTETSQTSIIGQVVDFHRTGSLFASRMTFGIKSAKINVQLPGAHAQVVTAPTPVFLFIPAQKEADAGVTVGDLVLIRLEKHGDRRQFEVGAVGADRASSGISITHQIEALRSEDQPGVYRLVPAKPLAPGEYALYLVRGEGLPPFVYDFTVQK